MYNAKYYIMGFNSIFSVKFESKHPRRSVSLPIYCYKPYEYKQVLKELNILIKIKLNFYPRNNLL